MKIEDAEIEKLARTMANAKLGEGDSVRCEGPTEFEINQARPWARRALASLSPAATPVSEADMIPRAKNVGRYLAETNDGRLLYLNHATEWQEMPNTLAKPATSPAPVRPIGNQGISDYQREIARNMAEGFAAWNAARQEALPSDEPASSPAGGDVAETRDV